MTEITPISEMNKKRFGEEINKYLTYSWVFEKGYEKIILVLFTLLGLWKLLELIGVFR